MFDHTILLYPDSGRVSAENKTTKTDLRVKRHPLSLGVCTSLPLLLGLACPTAQAALPEYIFTDLGTLGGYRSFAYDINNQVQVVGTTQTEALDLHAFVWTATAGLRDLGTLGGDYSSARAINDRGQIVGVSKTADGDEHAFLWTPGDAMRDLGTLGGPESGAEGIGQNGEVVGRADLNESEGRAFLWKDGVMQDLGEFFPNAINAQGLIVGRVNGHAALWSAGEGLRDLGTLGGGMYSAAYAINDQGQVAGSTERSPGADDDVGMIWTAKDGMQGLAGQEFLDINADGQAVGYGSWLNDSLNQFEAYAIRWTAADGAEDLNEAPGVKGNGWKLVQAEGINDAGQIVGWGEHPDGHPHAFLLTPVQLKCQGRLPTVLGGKGNDVLKGTAGQDVIQAQGGNDTILAGGGNDIVCGGAGNDKLYGGKGKNKLSGGPGKDTCKQGEKRSGCER
jgi:probable HAF family extracellular repeat protein